MSGQLPLGLRLSEDATLDNFVTGSNREAVSAVRNAVLGEGDRFLTLWGESGSGKSHLLQAACHQAAVHNLSTSYLSLSQASELSPEMLEGLEALQLICLDDLDQIAGQLQWEESLHHLYNGVRDNNGLLIAASRQPTHETSFSLADLKSRLSWGPSFHLQPLSDDDKAIVLQHSAQTRGLTLPEEVARYLLTRFSRDMHTLILMLDKLDKASMAEQKKLTIPFLKKQLANQDEDFCQQPHNWV